MGTNVDCYQRAEGKYELMRWIIAALRDTANPFSILTKGTLILRDLDLLLKAAEVTDVGLNVSAAFVDKELWRAIEPGTPAPQRRLDACATLNDNGLRCGVLMGPVVPFLSDSPAQLDAAVRQVAEAGTRAAHAAVTEADLRPLPKTCPDDAPAIIRNLQEMPMCPGDAVACLRYPYSPVTRFRYPYSPVTRFR